MWGMHCHGQLFGQATENCQRLRFYSLSCQLGSVIGPTYMGYPFKLKSEWLERLTANAVVATVLGSIPASSDTVESEGCQMKQC
jgi:hypothetical protein